MRFKWFIFLFQTQLSRGETQNILQSWLLAFKRPQGAHTYGNLMIEVLVPFLFSLFSADTLRL